MGGGHVKDAGGLQLGLGDVAAVPFVHDGGDRGRRHERLLLVDREVGAGGRVGVLLLRAAAVAVAVALEVVASLGNPVPVVSDVVIHRHASGSVRFGVVQLHLPELLASHHADVFAVLLGGSFLHEGEHGVVHLALFVLVIIDRGEVPLLDLLLVVRVQVFLLDCILVTCAQNERALTL